MCLHVLGSWIFFFFWEKVRWRYACMQFFVRLAGFTLYSIFFYLSGYVSRERGRSLVDLGIAPPLCYNRLVRTRAHFYFRSSPHFCRPSILLFFSNEHFHISPHLISSHLKLPLSINQLPRARVPSPQYLYFLLTHQGVKSPLLLSRMFLFVSLLPLSFDPWRAPLLSSRPTPLHCTTLPSSRPTRFPEIFTRTNRYTQQSSLLSFPHTPGFTISSKCQTKRQIRSCTAGPAAIDTDHV